MWKLSCREGGNAAFADAVCVRVVAVLHRDGDDEQVCTAVIDKKALSLQAANSCVAFQSGCSTAVH